MLVFRNLMPELFVPELFIETFQISQFHSDLQNEIFWLSVPQ